MTPRSDTVGTPPSTPAAGGASGTTGDASGDRPTRAKKVTLQHLVELVGSALSARWPSSGSASPSPG